MPVTDSLIYEGMGRRIRIKGPLLTALYAHPYESAHIDLPTGFDSVVRPLLPVRRSCPLRVRHLFWPDFLGRVRVAALLAAETGSVPLCPGIAPRFSTVWLCPVAASLPSENSARRKEHYRGDANEKPFHRLCPQSVSLFPFDCTTDGRAKAPSRVWARTSSLPAGDSGHLTTGNQGRDCLGKGNTCRNCFNEKLIRDKIERSQERLAWQGKLVMAETKRLRHGDRAQHVREVLKWIKTQF